MPQRLQETVSIGVDVGGTFTDIIAWAGDDLLIAKLPTSATPSDSVIRGVRGLKTDPHRVALVSHATTLATNALLTHTGIARTALVTNVGFRDVLEIGRQRRPELYDLNARRALPLVARRDRLTLPCRTGSDGSVVTALKEREASALARFIVRSKYASVAVCFLNSYIDGSQERAVRGALQEAKYQGSVTLSSEISPGYREYERTSTAVVNAALSPLLGRYLRKLRTRLVSLGVEAPIYVMGSDGGTKTLEYSASHPVTVIESGPAAGVLAARALARRLSLRRVLSFDMGGTTAKAGTVIDGEPDLVTEFEAAGATHSGRSIPGSGYPVQGQFVDLAEVSAGGGTIAWADDAGDLEVGPRSAGASPGPACYGRGGTEPTVTDANVQVGRLNPRHLLGGEMPIRKALARAALQRLSSSLGRGPGETAEGILKLVNDSMARALSIVSIERGRDPRDFTLVAFGGAGPLHACDLAEEMEITDLIVPAHPGLFSAYGLLAGELTRTFSMSAFPGGPRASRLFQGLESEAAEALAGEGFARYTTSKWVEARYEGQSHDLSIRYRGDSRLRRDFDARHRDLYGYSSADPLQVVAVRLTASVKRRVPSLASQPRKTNATKSSRRALIGGRWIEVPVYPRHLLPATGRGPCIVEEYDSTTVVNPSWKWSVEPYGVRLRR